MKRRHLNDLLNTYNLAANPAAYRTDHEHNRCRQLQRAVRRVLERQYREGVDYGESNFTGRLLPMSHRAVAS